MSYDIKDVMKKKVSDLTLIDKKLLVKHYVSLMTDNFEWALDYAKETGKLEDLKGIVQALSDDIEDWIEIKEEEGE
tara:strand:- start:210 stop:437 length:228 start_codon:yes stop_codon:yes gene_type:complete